MNLVIQLDVKTGKKEHWMAEKKLKSNLSMLVEIVP